MSAEATSTQSNRQRASFLKRLMRHKGGVFGVVVIGFFLVLGVFGPWIRPYDPNTGDLILMLQPPSSQNLLGTDDLGRDVLSRLIDASLSAIMVPLLSVAIALVIGSALGTIAGYRGGFIDTLVARSQDVIFSFPALLLAIIVVAVLGPGPLKATLAIGIVYTPRFVRLARSVALTVRSNEYLDAARLAGVKTPMILVRHMLPNVVPSVLVLAALSMSTAQLAYASLSFLGLGVNPPKADWGVMLATGRDFITIAPWLVIFPMICLVILMLAFNILGDAIRDVLDPRRKSGVDSSSASV